MIQPHRINKHALGNHRGDFSLVYGIPYPAYLPSGENLPRFIAACELLIAVCELLSPACELLPRFLPGVPSAHIGYFFPRTERTVMEQERIIYETLLKKRCTDIHWWRVKNAMKSCDLSMDRAGFELLINLRRVSPRFYTHFHKVKKKLDQKMKAIGDGMTGAGVRRYLETEGLTPSQSTLSRWFVKCGGYRATAFYNKTVLTPVIAMALIYKHRRENSTPVGDIDNE